MQPAEDSAILPAPQAPPARPHGVELAYELLRPPHIGHQITGEDWTTYVHPSVTEDHDPCACGAMSADMHLTQAQITTMRT